MRNLHSQFSISFLALAFIIATTVGLSTTTYAQKCLYGDVDQNGEITMADSYAWCELVGSGGPYRCEADGNYDGTVNLLDLSPFRDILLESQSEGFIDNTVSGPADFFWSTLPLGAGAVNNTLDLNVAIGETTTLYLYYSASGPSGGEIADGFAINVATSESGAIAFTEAGSMNYAIEFSGNRIETRWQYPEIDIYDEFGFGPAQLVQPDLIVGIAAMGLCFSRGILAENTNEVDGPFLDAGYDSNADAFLLGKVQLTGLAAGKVNLIAGPNSLGISDLGQMLSPTFTRVNISTSAGVLLGDVNMDGLVNLLDVSSFVDRLATNTFQVEADCNEDGSVNLLDVAAFVDILGSP